MKKKTTSPIWTIRGVNHDARELAGDAARRRSIPLGEWLSEAILEYAPASPLLDEKMQEEMVFDQLETLERRIAKFEKTAKSTMLSRQLGAGFDYQDLFSTSATARRQKT